MGATPPLVGYNTNVRHKGKLFHIQTEDSGISKPHVITHLFADGGRIVATRKTTYGEHVAAPDREDIVRRIMKDQHKAMFVALRDGVYDEPDASRPGAAVTPAAAPTPVVRPADGGFAPTPHSGIVAGFDPAVSAEGIPTPVDPSVVPPAPDSDASFSQAPAVAAARDELRVVPPPAPRPSAPAVPPRASSPPAAPRPASVPAPVRPSQSPGAAIAAARARRSAPPPAPARPAAPAAAARPASRPAQPRPAPPPSAPKTIFGQDLISEKSLDEVILSYLSRELDDK